ncbi:hypothetical protein TNCT_707671 [Trichonephila clavata]|uniref:Uncharacterized protein n=1 Tax=Trichonephila clavata TaxID=2740835 RepID=A0A8X6HLY7_TRICU|nr:hypothetical protein TNCT_707671 [Trichonephila clavata]
MRLGTNNSVKMKLKICLCKIPNASKVGSERRIEVENDVVFYQELMNVIFLLQPPELLSEISAKLIENGSFITEDM